MKLNPTVIDEGKVFLLRNVDEDTQSPNGNTPLWDEEQTTYHPRRREAPFEWSHVLIFVGYIPLILLSLFLYYGSGPNASANVSECTKLFDSPAIRDGAIQYELRRIPVNFRKSPYSGPPRPEVDAAWHDLVEISNMRVSREDLDVLNVSSVALADGSGYVAELGVFHEIHCLKRIRHWIYKDHYHQNATESEMKENEGHVHHCIEMLRLTSMCKADLSLSTFRWIGDTGPQLTAEDVSLHQCVKWEPLAAWLKGRTVDIRNEDLFVRD